jgi:hypothetical protein
MRLAKQQDGGNMAGELFDIGGLFKDVLADPKAQQQANYEQKLGMFNNGWAGTLANLGSTFGSDLRGYAQQAGSAVNPDFDIRTADAKYREAISAIDQSDENAEQQYIEATKRYKPAKLPQLMENIKQNKREEAAESRKEAELALEGRRVDVLEGQLANTVNETTARIATLEEQRAAAELQREVADFDFSTLKDNKEDLATGIEWLASSPYAKKNKISPEAVAILPEAAQISMLNAAIAYNEDLDGTLTDQLTLMYKGNPTITRAVLEGLTVAQKQTLAVNAIGDSQPDWTHAPGTDYLYNRNAEDPNATKILLPPNSPLRDARTPTNQDLQDLYLAMTKVDQRDVDAMVPGSDADAASFRAQYRNVEADLLTQNRVAPSQPQVIATMRLLASAGKPTLADNTNDLPLLSSDDVALQWDAEEQAKANSTTPVLDAALNASVVPITNEIRWLKNAIAKGGRIGFLPSRGMSVPELKRRLEDKEAELRRSLQGRGY